MKRRAQISAGAHAAATIAILLATPAAAQPQPAPPTPAIAAPRDVPYPGVIDLAVDATDLEHGIFAVRERIPVRGPGPITLFYPKWIPGSHSPSEPIDKLAGLVVTAGGRPLPWRRDDVDVWAFHVDAPAGAAALDLSFQVLSSVTGREGRVMMTPDMLSLQWEKVALYPAGYFARRITVAPSVTPPAGFTLATALETVETTPGGAAETTRFKPTTFNTLADSPLIAGRYFKSFDLGAAGSAKVRLDVVADRPGQLAASPEEIAFHAELVRQAYALFGSRHYDHYDFLLSLSDRMGGIGLEHHQSSEDGAAPGYFTDWKATLPGRDLLPHEFTHSWNGKFRRPADLWTANFNTPMRDSLLWVYEGQTQYWGYVLAARSGLMSRQETLDAIAAAAAAFDHRVGRVWRPLEDTTDDPIIDRRRPLSWRSWQRSEDYYSEGELVWLDADTLIRQLSGGRRSLDDFARAFFGIDDGSSATHTYNFDDVVKALDAVQPYGWAAFLHARLEGHGPGASLDGLARGGYRLVYADTPTDYFKSLETDGKVSVLTYSLGPIVGKDGDIVDVAWDGPAFKAGLATGAKIVAVDGLAYDLDDLKESIKAAKGAGPPIDLLVESNDLFRTVRIDYHDGPRYPRLERLPATSALLDDILAPRK